MSEKIKSLADLLRNKIAEPNKEVEVQPPIVLEKVILKKEIKPKTDNVEQQVEILNAIRAYDYSNGNKNMLHPRLDDKTIQMLSQFKIATGVDMNKTVAFAIHFLFTQNPELKNIIKKSLENFEL
ncbi:hypothetical protein FA048_12680 [Pedobacter polaris]|uniref:Uncharacterized protein n=1 Tax=Pedobacter polaris TaxID=2571273 RepID=A0A4U1CMX6_9SPHI|nr:hypothetical protein [Pedobacter polaris]TKC08013.1 hypothetical protein FA048_12680 [Pedobacter polaris]